MVHFIISIHGTKVGIYFVPLGYHLGHGPEGSDGVDVEAVLLLADRGEPFLHPRHMSLLVRFPKSCTQYST